ncbi:MULTISPECIES: hypothetical protein [Streptomyces]
MSGLPGTRPPPRDHADHGRGAWTIAGYVLTAATVPVLGLTGVLWVA